MTIAPRPNTQAWKQSPGFIQGHEGEQRVRALLQRLNYYVIPSYDYTGTNDNKAPKLHGALQQYVIPDLDTSHLRNGRAWIEVKTYTEPTLYRKANELQHGILKRHWDDYRKVERITRTPVLICIYEMNTQDILIASQLELIPFAEWREDKRGKGGQYYFPRNLMSVLANMRDYPDLLAERLAVDS